MSTIVYHISIESILCLTTIPVHVSNQEEWLSYPVRIHWRKLYIFFSLGNKCWCFPVWGWNPVFTSHFQCQSPHLTWTFVCLCVLLQSLSVLVFINFLVSLKSSITYGHEYLSASLLTSPAFWNLRESFLEAFQLGLSIAKPHIPSSLL